MMVDAWKRADGHGRGLIKRKTYYRSVVCVFKWRVESRKETGQKPGQSICFTSENLADRKTKTNVGVAAAVRSGEPAGCMGSKG